MASDQPQDVLAGAEHDIKEIIQRQKIAALVPEMMKSMLIDKFEAQVARIPKKTYVIDDDRSYSYEAVDAMACRVANIAHSWGLKAHDCVSIMIQNDVSFVWTFLGLQKLGISVGLLNFNLRAKALVHCIKAVECKSVIVGTGDDLLQAIVDVLPDLDNLPVYIYGTGQGSLPPGIQSFDTLLRDTFPTSICPAVRSDVKLTDNCVFIFTSGTTGYPKPVYTSQMKMALGCLLGTQVDFGPDDIVYTVLPLYHSVGLFMSTATAISSGATTVLRNKFSARHFWSDCRKHRVTVFPYIGEFMRYLLAQPKSDLDGVHNIRAVIGAGLRADIWKEVVERFKIPRIAEFFGATEGLSGLTNYAMKPGSVGRLSPLLRKFDPDNKTLVKFDISTSMPIRDKNGRCIPVAIGEPGLLLSKCPDHLRDQKIYKASDEANKKKMIRDAFAPGDLYMNYGDAFVMDKEYFVYFHDRLGDTFRWKGENVSTTEVANTICALPFIEDASVYGVAVPGHDGKAGMAALTLVAGAQLGNSELQQLYDHVQKELTPFARPLFLRRLPQAILTGTFKNQKVDLAKEGYDLTKIKDPVYVLDQERKTYSPLKSDSLVRLLKSRL